MSVRGLSRAEKVAAINQARAEFPNLTQRQIAEKLGMTFSALCNLLYDPDGSKQHARRARTAQPCPNCGRPMDSSNGVPGTPSQCHACMAAELHAEAYWTPDRLIQAAQSWARRFGHAPTTIEWRRAQVIDGERFPGHGQCYNPPRSKTKSTNRHVTWPSWSAFLTAAGFTGIYSGRRLARERERIAA